MKKSVNWPAPAKINWFLHITGRRPDGYHYIQTFFQFLEFSDRLDFTFCTEEEITMEGFKVGKDDSDDLTVKAAKLLKSSCDVRGGVSIRLKKNIPVGGGLGGGSSDAATVLVALNALWDLNLSEEALSELALQLGADVPVFVAGRAAWAEGIGELLYEQKKDEKPVVLLFPGVAVSTAEVFQSPELTRDSVPIKMDTNYLSGYRNDCEAVTRRLYPEIADALDWLSKYGKAQMSGTGSSIFAEFDRPCDAEKVIKQIPTKWSAVACRTLNRSPLVDRLRSFHDGRES